MTTPVSDLEPGLDQPKHYHVLAQIMSRETNLAIFRRFEDLNWLRLMRLQAEIMEAKVIFEDRCKQDYTESPDFSRSFRALLLSRKAPTPVKPPASPADEQLGSSKAQSQGTEERPPLEQTSLWQCSQLELLQYMDRKLSEYMSQVRSIRKPEKSQLRTLRNWLARKDGGDNFLEGSERLIWAESAIDEYVCLATPGTETDTFTFLIRKLIVTLFPWFFRGKQANSVIEKSSGLRSYDDARINSASNVISLVLSSTLPVLAIFVLNGRESTNERLWFTVLFTAVFAMVLGIFSSAKRAEIFAATATFAAIEVVFIGTAIGAGNDK